MRRERRLGVTMMSAKTTITRPPGLPESAALRALRAALSLLPAVLLSGCFADVKQSTVHPESDSARVIQDVYAMVTWIDTGIFILVAQPRVREANVKSKAPLERNTC